MKDSIWLCVRVTTRDPTNMLSSYVCGTVDGWTYQLCGDSTKWLIESKAEVVELWESLKRGWETDDNRYVLVQVDTTDLSEWYICI